MGTRFKIVAYTADASVWCVDCAKESYPELIDNEVCHDSEDNEIWPVFQWDDTSDLFCDCCGLPIDDTL